MTKRTSAKLCGLLSTFTRGLHLVKFTLLYMTGQQNPDPDPDPPHTHTHSRASSLRGAASAHAKRRCGAPSAASPASISAAALRTDSIRAVIHPKGI